MKRAKWALLALPFAALLWGASVVAQKRRVLLINTQFRRALDLGDEKDMIRWLRLGANPNVDGKDGRSALDYAVSTDEGITELTTALLRAHADVNRLNAQGAPPLEAV